MDLTAWLQSLALAYGFFGVFFVSLISHATIFLPLPSYLIVYALGPQMNPFLLGIFAGVGAALGELTSYFVGYGVEKGTHLEEKKSYPGVRKAFKKYGFWAIPVFALTPLPTDIIGLVAGILRYPLLKFFLGCLIGKIILHWVMAYGGAYSFEIVKSLFGKEGSIIGFFLLVLLIAIACFAWSKHGKRIQNYFENY